MPEMAEIADEAQYVTLCLGAEVFAVPVAFVREILDYRETFRIPEGPDFLLGLIDVRGRGTPVIDLRTKLNLPGMPPTPSTRIMVVNIPIGEKTLNLGLVADRVLEVVSFSRAQIEAAPDVGTAWRSDYICGVVRGEQGFVVLCDLPRLFAADEAAALSPSILEAA
jgi:purine-binding chemotaxis protein CheW